MKKPDRILLGVAVVAFALAGVITVVGLVVAGAMLEQPKLPPPERPTVSFVENVDNGVVLPPVETYSRPGEFLDLRHPPGEDPHTKYVEDAIARVNRGLEYHKGQGERRSRR